MRGTREHGALTLRTLQTLAEVATEHNSTLVLPIPMDMLETLRGASAPDPGRAVELTPQADGT